MNLSQLRFFTAIAETGSLSAAARKMNVSQPALSKYLSELEQGLGLKLFYRFKGKMRLTAAGCVYIASANRILEIEQSTINTIQNLNTVNQPLYIGGTPHEGEETIAQIYPILKRVYPQYDLRLIEGYTQFLYQLIHNGEADFALTTYLQTSLDVEFLPLFEQELVLCVPSYYRPPPEDFSSALVDLQDFAKIPFVAMNLDTSIGTVGRQLLESEGIDPLIVYSSNSSYMVHEMILAGAGGGLLPIKMMRETSRANYFRLKRTAFVQYGLITKKNHVFCDAERYIIYLLLKREEGVNYIRFCQSPQVNAILEEHDHLGGAFSGGLL